MRQNKLFSWEEETSFDGCPAIDLNDVSTQKKTAASLERKLEALKREFHAIYPSIKNDECQVDARYVQTRCLPTFYFFKKQINGNNEHRFQVSSIWLGFRKEHLEEEYFSKIMDEDSTNLDDYAS